MKTAEHSTQATPAFNAAVAHIHVHIQFQIVYEANGPCVQQKLLGVLYLRNGRSSDFRAILLRQGYQFVYLSIVNGLHQKYKDQIMRSKCLPGSGPACYWLWLTCNCMPYQFSGCKDWVKLGCMLGQEGVDEPLIYQLSTFCLWCH